MLHHNTLFEIETNTNTGVEYEIALFYKLISNNADELAQVKRAIKKRNDSAKVEEIISYTNTSKILTALRERGLTYKDLHLKHRTMKSVLLILYCLLMTNPERLNALVYLSVCKHMHAQCNRQKIHYRRAD